MKPTTLLFIVMLADYTSCQAQTAVKNAKENMTTAAVNFLQSLSAIQIQKAQFAFDAEDRYNWHYIPKERKGIPIKELNTEQYNTAMELLHAALSDTGFKKTTAVIKLEGVLREVEGRTETDDYRDAGKYYFSIFGKPATDKIWGWRLEGHHISFNFSSENNQLVSGTPGFIGSNPAVVLSGPEKGLEILKDETELGFNVLHSLNADQKKKAAFASKMMKEGEDAGMSNLRFAWAGDEQRGVGHPHYYRIQGPTLIIEYDNTQNNANHIHTVVRDLKNDFGGDVLLEHYKNHKN